ncbi:MAG TPA: LD-carboxypeptidase [Leptolyngbyaceae cyanobacterium]
MIFNRRQFLQTFGIATLATQLPQVARSNTSLPPIIKPAKLKSGDTIGLVNPAGATSAEDIEDAKKTLESLGFKLKLGSHVFDRYGYLAGKDIDRASDINAMFADRSVKAIIAGRGGWGCNRILPLLDYKLIRNNPKIMMGYSDITSLLLAIYVKSGVVTFHGPVATSTWNDFTLNYAERILFNGESVVMQNPPANSPTTTTLICKETITSGKAKGKLVGGNLSVLVAMIGSDYLPNWKQTILFLEEVEEEVYRVDRMLTQLKLAGILNQISGFIFGQCTKCDPKDRDKSLTLTQVLREHIQPLGIPAWYGSAIGHIKDKFTLPIGVEVEIDAGSGTIKMLESATINA